MPSQVHKNMTFVLSAYVFGPEWQDIQYFTNLESALDRLKNDALHRDERWLSEFCPMVVTYRAGNGDDGRLYEKHVWKMDKNRGEPYCRTAEQEWGC